MGEKLLYNTGTVGGGGVHPLESTTVQYCRNINGPSIVSTDFYFQSADTHDSLTDSLCPK